MKVRVKLYGTFGRRFPQARAAAGMEMEIPSGASAKDLLARLEIREDQGGVVILNNRILKMADEIPPGAEVGIFQRLYGG
ncbi:MAG: MoaD/ThiS family protein [Deltaproteobacteria bacterium]|nr:MoaD/ThiS family protein [Deltaproteobacteria bacterium]